MIKVFFDRSKDVKADVQIYDVVAAFDKEIESKKDKAFSKVKENKFLLLSFIIPSATAVKLFPLFSLVP